MKKIKLLSLTLVFALMLMGVAYAAWTDQLVLEATVATGIMDVNFMQGEEVDPAITASDYVDASVEFDPEDEGNDTLNVIIDNLYPGAVATLTFGVSNDSTIPVIGKLFVNAAADNTLDLSRLLVTVNGDSLGSVQDLIDTYAAGVDIGQYDVGENDFLTVTLTLDPTLTGDEEEDSSAAFTVRLDCRQYNA
jgi:hypothetical protein